MARSRNRELFQSRRVLAKGIQVIVFLFAAFSGFFLWVAPPDQTQARFAVGYSSFVALGLFLLIAALAKGHRQGQGKTAWLVTFGVLFALGAWAGLRYRDHLGEYAFAYPPELVVRNTIGGVSMNTKAERVMKENAWDKGDLLAYYGPQNIHQIWTAESIATAERTLTLEYVVFVVALASALFAVAEGILGQPAGRPRESVTAKHEQPPLGIGGAPQRRHSQGRRPVVPPPGDHRRGQKPRSG